MPHKSWNWKHTKWPKFTYDKEKLKSLELEFSKHTGTVLGILKHINKQEKEDFLVHILSNEALKTSEIEGEIIVLKHSNYSSLLTKSIEKAGKQIAIYSHSTSKGLEY